MLVEYHMEHTRQAFFLECSTSESISLENGVAYEGVPLLVMLKFMENRAVHSASQTD